VLRVTIRASRVSLIRDPRVAAPAKVRRLIVRCLT
jgi:hypothetical protein